MESSSGGPLLECLFDDPVFAGVEGDDRQGALGGQECGGDFEKLAERFEFLIHGHAERLEGSRGGMDVGVAADFQHPPDERFELPCGEHRVATSAVLDDGPRNAPGAVFAAQMIQDVGQVFFRQVAQKTGTRAGGFGVHPHIQRCVVSKGEAAFGAVELHGGDAQVGKDGAWRLIGRERVEPCGQVAEVGFHQFQADMVFDGSMRETFAGEV